MFVISECPPDSLNVAIPEDKRDHDAASLDILLKQERAFEMRKYTSIIRAHARLLR